MAKNKTKRKKPYEWMKPGTRVYGKPHKNIIYKTLGHPFMNRKRWRVCARSENGTAQYYLLCCNLYRAARLAPEEEQEPLEGVILPYHEVVVFRDLHNQWQVRCLVENEEKLKEQLGKLWFNTKKEALKAIGELE